MLARAQTMQAVGSRLSFGTFKFGGWSRIVLLKIAVFTIDLHRLQRAEGAVVLLQWPVPHDYTLSCPPAAEPYSLLTDRLFVTASLNLMHHNDSWRPR